MSRMRKLVDEFREVEMKKKLEESLDMRIYKYRHQKPYSSGDKVWYQNKNSSSWSGPAIVINHDSNMVWLRAGGDIKKVAKHRVQPFGDVKEGGTKQDTVDAQTNQEINKESIKKSNQESKINQEINKESIKKSNQKSIKKSINQEKRMLAKEK